MTIGPFPVGTVVGAFLLGFPTLFSIINPIGASLVFYNVTAGRMHLERQALALRISMYALLILLGSLLLGGYVLNFFGVSLGALRVGGGLVVAVQAWRLLMAPDTSTAQKVDQAAPAVGERPDIAFFPLTMPLTTGPGSISVAIALASQRPAPADSLVQFFAGVSLAALANVVFIWACFAYADQVMKIMGESGARVVSRLAAFLLLCIGVQIISTGVESLIGPWLVKTAHMV